MFLSFAFKYVHFTQDVLTIFSKNQRRQRCGGNGSGYEVFPLTTSISLREMRNMWKIVLPCMIHEDEILILLALSAQCLEKVLCKNEFLFSPELITQPNQTYTLK